MYLFLPNSIPITPHAIWTHYYKFEKLLIKYILYVHYLINAFFFTCDLHSPPITMSVYLILLLKNSHQCISLHLSPDNFPHSDLSTQGKTSEVKLTQSCLTPCDPIEYVVHGSFQARILEWVAIPFSRGSSQPRDRTQVSCKAGRFFTREALILLISEQLWMIKGSDSPLAASFA